MNLQKKPVILIILDTLMSTPLEEAAQTGYAPALQFLMDRGNYIPHMVSSFPTMSVVIESTLLTGKYSDQHHLPALLWYHQDENRIVNCGTGIKEIIKTGYSQFVKDMYYGLNNVYLSKQVKTIHEELAERGLESASINAYVYRGTNKKTIKLPKVLQLTTGIYRKWEVQTPTYWSLGAFSKLNPLTFTPQPFSGNYKASFQELNYLIRKRLLPPFTICVVQDLDLRIHLKGPMDLNGIKKIDRQLRSLLQLFPSWDHALEACTWIIMSDNGQASMGKKRNKYVIDLRKVLRGVRLNENRSVQGGKDEVVLCVNQRTAFVYCIGNRVKKRDVVHLLQQDKRIDIIAWEESEHIHVVSGEKQGKFTFSRGGIYRDPYGQSWTVSGNGQLLDLTLSGDRLTYGDFPDALARLASSLRSHKGEYLVITAKPGYEFKEQASPLHVGGAAHGSLHKQDSLVPMIVAGADTDPKYERIVDLKDWILPMLIN